MTNYVRVYAYAKNIWLMNKNVEFGVSLTTASTIPEDTIEDEC